MSQTSQDRFGLIGRSLEGGKYTVTGISGAGGFAIVYDGTDQLGARVAIKVLAENRLNNIDLVQRFMNEARNLAEFRQKPHIVNILSYGTEKLSDDQEIHYYVMPWLKRSLRTLLNEQKGKPMALSEWVRVADQVSLALEVLHGRSFIHRDVKPENILLDEDDSCILTDFGLVRQEDFDNPSIPSLTAGTPQYMAPEQIEGRALDQRSDVYAFGVVLFELATGRRPTREAPISDQLAGLHPDQARLIAGCAELDRQKRTPGMGEFREGLRQVQGALEACTVNSDDSAATVHLGDEVPERKPPVRDELRPARRMVGPPALLGGAAALVIAVIAVVYLARKDGGTKAPTGGYVALTSQPAGAQISVDGRAMNEVTPGIVGPVGAGEHQIGLELAGFEPWTSSLVVAGTDTSATHAVLKPEGGMLGELDIRSEPPGAAIYLDTEETGEVTPAVLGDVAPGAHRVRMVLDGHQPFEQSVEVAAGDISGVTATLTRASATLVVDSRPRGAVVYLDGQLTGKKTRCTLDDLAQGEHRLRLTRSGYRETRVTVQLEPGASLERTFTLRPLPAGKLVATAVIIQNGREVATTAELLVNGKARGTMPGTFNLPGGTYRLAGKKFGYRQVGGEKKEMVQGGKTTTVVLKFVKD